MVSSNTRLLCNQKLWHNAVSYTHLLQVRNEKNSGVVSFTKENRKGEPLKLSLIHIYPASMRLCTLLDKPDRRVKDVKVDYCGFEIPDEFVVGYAVSYTHLALTFQKKILKKR